MQDMAFYASIHSVLEKRWFVAELGFSPCTIIGSGLLRKECGASKFVLDVYKDFGQTVHSTSCAMSDVRVRTVTRIAYVAQNRFGLPCHISYNCRSQARIGLTSFILLYHLIIIQYDNNGREQG